ncbi:TetR family transcriptional regulator [Methylocystis bryophila]|nr:TetR family transcriptional regulator [Methylocystis bryophila]
MHGFSGTSVDAIARSAGVSKATLYAYFPSKEALFTHLIEAECKDKCGNIPSPDLDRGLAPALHVLCRHFIDFFLSPDSAAFFQTISNERYRFPELCHLYFNSGKKNVLDFLAAYLEQARDKGLLSFDDPPIVAEQLLNLAVADLPLRAALGLEARGEAEAERIMEAGIATFLKAYGSPNASSG